MMSKVKVKVVNKEMDLIKEITKYGEGVRYDEFMTCSVCAQVILQAA